MKSKLTKKQEQKIRSLTKQGKTQGQIAKAIHKQKLVVSKYMQAEGLGRRKATGSTLFWRDVKTQQHLLDMTHKEATRTVFKSDKWHTKRMNRLTDKNRMAAEKWQELGNKARAMRFKEFKRRDFKEQTGVRVEDYLDYFDSD